MRQGCAALLIRGREGEPISAPGASSNAGGCGSFNAAFLAWTTPRSDLLAFVVYGLGVIVGGLILGITETLTGYYVSSGYKDVPGLVLLLLVLSLKPAGLFGKAAIKKV